MPRGTKRFNLFIINSDTESTKEGYMSAFIASRPDISGRFPLSFPPPGKKPSKKWIKAKADTEAQIERIPRLFTTTKQSEVKTYFELLHDVMDKINDIFGTLKKAKQKTDYQANCIVFYANMGWDLDVIRGIIFKDTTREVVPTGTDSDLVQLRFGFILFRDFLRMTGFASVKMAGMICSHAHKLDGNETYELTKEMIPEKFEDYPETIQAYIKNDVAVMDEAFSIFMNQSANQCIQSLDDLPMTLTGFSRYRQQHLPEIIMINGEKKNNASQVTNFRWKQTRPYILYEIDAFKGGYCGPNPHIQYKILKNGICYDAVSMYPDKMCAHRQLQTTSESKMLRTTRTLEEIADSFPNVTEDEKTIMDYFIDTLQFFDKIDSEGFQPGRIDEGGIYGYIATIEMKINGVRFDPVHNIAMMPFLSVYKTEDPIQRQDHVITANGKVISAERFKTKLSCVDIILTMMCYDVEIIRITHMLKMGWRNMLPTQLRSVLYGYNQKKKVSETLSKPRPEQQEYWVNDCGFNFDNLMEMSDEEFTKFGKTYKLIIKSIPNGEYGKTVEKPIHQHSWNGQDPNGVMTIEQESPAQCMQRVYYWMQTQGGFVDRYGDEIPKEDKPYPPENWGYPVPDTPPIPENVKCNDYAAGASITMWARWQLISMMYILFCHGIEVWYCDTDSEFCEDSPLARELIERFNTWKTDNWKTYYFYNDECYTSPQLGNLGQFENDKEFSLFCTLGAKNYCIVDKKTGKFKITIAGLNTSIYEKTLNAMNEDKELIMYKYYRPNLFIEPSACRKLVKTRKNSGFDEQGNWCGSVLEKYGFAMIAVDSKFHLNNLRRAEEIQGLPLGTYCGKWVDKLYLTENGFSAAPSEANDGYEAFLPLEDKTRFIQGKEVISE